MVISRKSVLDTLLTRKIGRLEYAGWLILVPVLSVFGILALAAIYKLFELFGLYSYINEPSLFSVLLGIFISWFLVALPGHWRLGGLGAGRMLKTLYWFAALGLPFTLPLLYFALGGGLPPLPNPLKFFTHFEAVFVVLYFWYGMIFLWLCYQFPFLLVKKLPKFLTRKI